MRVVLWFCVNVEKDITDNSSSPQTEITKLEKPPMRIWLRLGVSLFVSEENGKKILNGDGKIIEEILKSPSVDNFWKPDGESYIPAEIMEQFGYECFDLEFELPTEQFS